MLNMQRLIKWIKWILWEKEIHKRMEIEKELREVDKYISNLYREAKERINRPIPPCNG